MGRRKFQRAYGSEGYKRIFIIVPEGRETECDYFRLLQDYTGSVLKTVKPDKKSAPHYLLKKMKKKLDGLTLRKNDEAWIVVDKDQWPDEQLQRLLGWAQESEKFNLAVSNPCFECWLILHFEDCPARHTEAALYSEKLKLYLSGYDKSLLPFKTQFTRYVIAKAIQNAEERHRNSARESIPGQAGETNIHLLVKKIINS